MKCIVVCTLVNVVNCRSVQLQKAVVYIAKLYDCTGIFWWRDHILLMYVCFIQHLFCNNILISYRDCIHIHTLLYVEAWPFKFIQVFVIAVWKNCVVFCTFYGSTLLRSMYSKTSLDSFEKWAEFTLLTLLCWYHLVWSAEDQNLNQGGIRMALIGCCQYAAFSSLSITLCIASG